MEKLFSISQIANITGKDRRTISAKLAAITPAKESTNLKQYSIEQLLKLAFNVADLDSGENFSPAEELAYWTAKLKELEYKKRINEVCEASDVARQFSLLAKGILQPFETLPDEGEADGMPLNWVMWLQKKIDKNRDVAAEVLSQDEDNEDVRKGE